ncbi:hypothetical protein INT47_012512 [Mucor saturninus]|uniref:Uncharacterized protein n=1 Tax=Mucor saturninus TaxID=64648 RepID=A0A8H7QR67_9FUNG|nr:hypothetical protein INT47_012512 [Mucor saturninus]
MDFQYSNFDLIVSLDFGNSFSGTCYALTGNLSPKELREKPYPSIIHVTDWPKQNDLQHKTPTINVYNRNFHLLHWGMSAFNFIQSGLLTDDQQIVERFKFNLPTSISQTGAFLPTGTTSIEQLLNMRATIDYLRETFDSTLNAMRNSGITVANLDSMEMVKKKVRFVITVPGQWNDIQRELMRIIAIEAGLISKDDHEKRLLMINESLAASLYCERKPDIQKIIVDEYRTGLMQKNSKYIVCDAGGSTVSIAVFESTENGDQNNADSFRRCQLTTEFSVYGGSTYLDLKMEEILLDICFGADKENWENNKLERQTLKSLIAPLTNQFLIDKTTFGKARKDFLPDCCRKLREMYYNDSDWDSDSSHETNSSQTYCDCGFDNGHDEQYVELDDFGDGTIFAITLGRILDRMKLRRGPDGVVLTDKGVTVEEDGYQCEITFSYKFMREHVFDEVIDNTIDLLRRQIKKANGNITHTFMVGGFGGSPYLCKRILNEFPAGSELSVGNLINDDRGDTAAMRGAMIYGINESRKDPQSSVVVSKYEDDSTSQYNTLVCLDIGYGGTACSYKDLRHNSDDMTEITDWPGSNKKSFVIPIAKKNLNGKASWGAQVKQTTYSKPALFITPSKLMSSVNGIFKKYLTEFLELVSNHVHNLIAKTNPELSDKSKYKYVITMENCYPFFKHKSEMRLIAQMAGIINKGDPVKRLLLIRRENAAAMYFEKTVFTGKKADRNHFLQISLYHDTCHLSLHESSKIIDYGAPAKETSGFGETTSDIFRNVRSMRSATFKFNFVSTLVKNFDLFVSNSACCKDQKSHDTTDTGYILELTSNFLEYNKLDFNSNEAEIIGVTKSPGCQISITKYEVLEHIFWPAIRELTAAIKSNGMQRNVFRLFNIDKIFLSGILIEAKKETYTFLEKMVIKNLSEVMNVKQGTISSSESSGKEALLGAAYYGNHPESFTERISRRSYAVQVSGFKRQDFDELIEEKISKIKLRGEKNMKDIIYNVEATNAYIDKNKPVQLYHQSYCNPSNSENEDSIRTRDDITSLISKGTEISEHNQMHGISKRFYAVEECIVYVTIYSSDDPILPKNGTKLDLTNFDKLHQFELYIKRDEDDPTTVLPDSRLHFDVRLKPDKENFKFEAFVCSKLGNPAPEFILPDEFLVTNIYGDE